tara:strand:+ start:281 stop:850 length:570 start_codon:yes stop_codon:yes gene_type:complete
MIQTDKKKFIGFIGPIGSGKSTACTFFSSRGYHVVSLSDIIRAYVHEHNYSDDRDSLTHHANQLKEKYGMAYFAQQSYDNVIKANVSAVVFDSIRHPDEASFLKEKGVYLVGIKANQTQRFHRISNRKHSTDFVDLTTFINQDENELKGANQGQNIEACYTLCDQCITNDKELEHFTETLNSIFSTFVS